MDTQETFNNPAAEAARAHYFRMNGLDATGKPLQPEPTEQDESTSSGADQQGASANETDAAALAAEFTKLQNDYNAVLGRVGPAQQELEATRRSLREAQAAQAAKEAELQQKIAELSLQVQAQQEAAFDPAAVLSEDEALLFDAAQLTAVRKIAQAVAAKESAAQQAVRKAELAAAAKQFEEQRRQDKLAAVFADSRYDLSWVQSKASDPVLNAWLASDDGLVANQLLATLVSAKIPDLPRLATAASKALRKFPGHPSAGGAPSEVLKDSDMPARLASHAARQSQVGTMDNAQVAVKLAEASQLSAMGGAANMAKARKILDELKKAHPRPGRL